MKTNWWPVGQKCDCGNFYTIQEVEVNADGKIRFYVCCVRCGPTSEHYFPNEKGETIADIAFRAFKKDVARQVKEDQENGEREN